MSKAGTRIALLTPAGVSIRLAVASASLASGVCIVTAGLLWLSEGPDRFAGLAILSAFWLPYLLIAFRVRGEEKIKSGLTLAVAMGSALFVPGLALIYYVHEWHESWWIQGTLVLALLLQPILVMAAIRAYKSLPAEPQDPSKAAVSGAYGVLLFGLFWFTALFGNFPSPTTYDESQAMESMRSVYMTAESYANAHSGFFPDASIDSATREKVECTNDRPRMYHHNEEHGYIIDYQVVPAKKPVAGCRVAVSYTAAARPAHYGKTGRRSFFVDQTKVIRFTSEDRAATAEDPELPASSLPRL